jgi:hypothetical protein
MRKITLSLLLLGAVGAPLLATAPAQAQATRTWVSGAGDDANPCSRTQPCMTFAGAITKTAINGEINCLDAAGFGSVSVTKSITIDCHDLFASVLATNGVNGIVINAGNFDDATDPLKTVRLRNLNLAGRGDKPGDIGIRIIKAKAVIIEDTLVDGFASQGILDERTDGGKLFVSNSTLRNNGKAGLGIGSDGGKIEAVVTNVISHNNQYGFAVGSGVRATVTGSSLSSNSLAGAYTEKSGEISVENSVLNHNGFGFQQTGGPIRFANSQIAYNGTLGSGTGNSFSNNRVFSNGGGGILTAISPAGTNPSGMQ